MIEIRKGRYSTITPRIGGTLLPSSVVSSPGPSGQSDPGKRGALARRSSSPGKGGNCRDIHATRMCVHVGVLASCVHIDLNIHTTSMHAGMHTYVCTDIYIYIYPYTHIYIYIVTYSYTVHLHMHIHTYIHTYTHTYAHTYMHTYIHMHIQIYRLYTKYTRTYMLVFTDYDLVSCFQSHSDFANDTTRLEGLERESCSNAAEASVGRE